MDGVHKNGTHFEGNLILTYLAILLSRTKKLQNTYFKNKYIIKKVWITYDLL